MEPKQRKQQDRATKRFSWIMFAMIALGLYILGTALHSMLFEYDYFNAVSKRFTKANIPIPARRGDMLDCNGHVMVSSVPEYQLYLDVIVIDKDSAARARTQAWRDSALIEDKDSICDGLARIFPDKTADYFRARIDKVLERNKRVAENRRLLKEKHIETADTNFTISCRLYPRNASYIQYRQCQQLPLLREAIFKGGFHGESTMMRKKPYGSLANRTLGLYVNVNDTIKEGGKIVKIREVQKATNGLEEHYDSILSGTDGVKHRSKVRDKRVDFIDREPVEGHDLMTTIDVNIQDIAERAIVAQMHKMHEESGATAELGMVMVMECATGDIKAMVNMSLCGDGQYYEIRNNAIADRLEPGSTFKTASIMAAIEDGRITKHTMVNTGNGTKKMYGRNMNDAGHIGHGLIDVKKVMQKSSNVGVSTLIDNAYHGDPESYVEAIKREGMGIPLNLPFRGAADPLIKNPKSDFWYKTTLPWMSIGYETLLPPINTITFYNGIANGGKMVKPRFVKAELENGKVVRNFPVETLREQMCSKSTLADIQEILESVVSGERATGNRAACPQFKCSGKTGTAQIAGNAKDGGGKGYGTGWHLVSFVGYFPSEAPKYTCMVSIKAVGPAGGGTSCGPVFSQIAQSIMANGVFRAPYLAADSTSMFAPYIWNGNMNETVDVLKALGVSYTSTWDKSDGLLWGQANADQADTKKITLTETTAMENKVPDVIGMGARDAVFKLQQCGLKVKVSGVGHVKEQDLNPGSDIVKGKTITLKLS